ncbi:PilZ domain-containing protein [Myxococcota bacterium]|nr:PilZ domain-containing protein [Myxococcota bacterium]MCZ7617969.1 PilZ domain-containing protein [Myxococcota bacterium]
MSRLVTELERREVRRVRPRAECELFVGARRFEGLIEDASRGGVFVRTIAEIRPGAQVRVRWAGTERFAVVIHHRPVPSFLRWVSVGGLGLRWATLDSVRAA